LTYRELLGEVRTIAAALRGLGVGRGDRVTIHMPTNVEAIATMLAVLRVGAIHAVVFAGFGAGALGDRIRACGSKVVIASDLTYRKGKDVPLEEIVGAGTRGDPGAVEHVVIHRRGPLGAVDPSSGDLAQG